MARERNPRGEVHLLIKELYQWAQSMHRAWQRTPSVRWYDAGDGRGERWQERRRKRVEIPDDEFIENHAQDWRTLARYMRAVQRRAAQIEAYANARATEVEGGKRW